MDTTSTDSKRINGRREFLKKGAYVAPLIVTLTAVPAFASSGSGYNGNSQGQNDNSQGDNDNQGQNQQ